METMVLHSQLSALRHIIKTEIKVVNTLHPDPNWMNKCENRLSIYTLKVEVIVLRNAVEFAIFDFFYRHWQGC